MKKILIIGIILLFFGSSVPLMAHSVKSNINSLSDGHILYVGGSGPGNYTRIQDALNDTKENDTVFVYKMSSPYHENLVISTKSITLMGEDLNASTIINGSRKNAVIKINADSITIKGFTTENGEVGVECNNSILTWIWYNKIIENNYGVRVYNADPSTMCADILGNIISYNNYAGIALYSDLKDNGHNKNAIAYNDILYNREGIILNSSWSDIQQNRISHNSRHGIILGLNSSHNQIHFNSFYHNQWGIASSGSSYLENTKNSIFENKFESNTIGMLFNWSESNSINGNFIFNSSYGIYFFYYSDDNSIYHNTFLKNKISAKDYCNNTWSGGEDGGGNYWDDYSGLDQNNDGFGDSPYNISGGLDKDYYPLIEPASNHLFFMGRITLTSTRNVTIFHEENVLVFYFKLRILERETSKYNGDIEVFIYSFKGFIGKHFILANCKVYESYGYIYG